LLQPADLRGDVGFGQAQDFGDVRVTALVEIEQQQCAIERVEGVDAAAQQAQALGLFRFVGVAAGRIVELGIERHRSRYAFPACAQ